MRVLEDLGLREPHDAVATAVASSETKKAFLEMECMRRTYWLIHLSRLLATAFILKPTSLRRHELPIRLPCDEFCFELTTPSEPGKHQHSCRVNHTLMSELPEYLYRPALNTLGVSEFGQLIRVANIFSEIYILKADKSEFKT